MVEKHSKAPDSREPSPPKALKITERSEVRDVLGAELEKQKLTPEKREAILALVEGKMEKKEAIFQDTREMRNELAQAIRASLEKSKSVPDDENLANALAQILQEEIIEGEMKVDDLRVLKLAPLLKLEADRPGLLLFAFTTWGIEHQKVDIDHFESYAKPKSGDRFTIDFRGNAEAYWKVGADNILPPDVREITVWPQGDPSKARISKRRVGLKGGVKNPKSGFFDEQGYIPIFSGDVVIVGHPVEKSGALKSKSKPEEELGAEPKQDEKAQPTPPISQEGGGTTQETPHFEGGLMSSEDLTKYRKADGTWNLEEAMQKYETEHGKDDEIYLKELWKKSKKEAVEGDLKPGHYDFLKQKKMDAKDLNAVLNTPERREWKRYAGEAAQYYANEFGVSVKPAVVFAIIDNESNFNPTIVNQEGLAKGKSPDKLAVGLGQFMPSTWLQFVKENKEVVRRICGRVPWTRGGKLELRTNPELGIWATTWLAAKSARGLNLRREGGVTEENAYKIYLAHAEGVGGYGKLEPFFEGRVAFADNKAAAAREGRSLESWQDENHASFIRDYARKLEQKAKRYTDQMGDSFSPQ